MDIRIIRPNIDTSINPIAFLGSGWSLGNQDKNSLALSEIKSNKIILLNAFPEVWRTESGLQYINFSRETRWIRLDARFFWYFWEHQDEIPAIFKERVDGEEYPTISFDGSEVWGPGGFICTLCLTWNGRLWNMGFKWLDYTWNRPCLSAVIPF